MKKIFTLLALVMISVCAMAQTTYHFKGTWHSNPSNFADYDGNLTVTVNDLGSYAQSLFVFDHVVLGDDDLGEITIPNVWTEFEGTQTNFSMGTGTTFNIKGGNLDIEGGTVESYLGYINDDGIYINFNYFEYSTRSYRKVVFQGTPTTGGSTDPDEPTVVSTENFTEILNAQVDGSAQATTYENVKASLSEYSDGTYAIAFDNLQCELGNIGGVVLSGLKKNSSDEYVGYVDAQLLDESSVLVGKELKADIIAHIDDDGYLVAVFPLLTEDGLTRIDFSYAPEDEDEPADPISVEGTLSGFTHTDDGDFSNTAQSTITFTENDDDSFTVELTNVKLPSATIDLGTVTLTGVDCDANKDLMTSSFSKTGGVCTTTAEHPLYTELDVKSFEANVQLEAGATDDDEEVIVKSATAKLVIDNYEEEVTYTFSLTPIVDAINNVNAANGAVKRIYTISGVSVNTMQRGINIVRTADGKTVKTIKK